MENQSPNYIPRRRDHHQEPSSDFNLNDWDLKASRISRHNTSSRRFSASNIRSFREDNRSFRSNFTTSSTASSPGYPCFRDEIDPSTYSFTTALKALQARSGYLWECLSPEGFALNSKWSDAEKYISNPLSGQVPMECLSSKTLSARSFRNMMTSRITMSAPLIYSASSHHSYFSVQTSNKLASPNPQENVLQIPIQEKKVVRATRDIGIQSTLTDLTSSSPSLASTPSIGERMPKRCSADSEESPHSNSKMKSEEEVPQAGAKEETGDEEEEEGSTSTRDSEEGEKEDGQRSCRCRQVGCLSWMSKRKQRENHRRRPARKIKALLSQIGAC
ncbi:uncharacterized protein LOC115737527 isoform X1 [Rhodamnia argentea]|uniref:Uncharacterized protein LOC115737527 isoform X1 n=1 Tax=Rhodamnia argentea TaxID=178133 RepID=A0A8B8NSV7_9MYRT|nr:uncharacterized protein LOC115737527 isoform X1 [Rhodamnia argentea]